MSDDRVDPKSEPPRPRMRSESQEIAYARALFEVRKLPIDQRVGLLEEANLDRANDLASLHHFAHNVLHPAIKEQGEKHEATMAGIAGLQRHLEKQDEVADERAAAMLQWTAKDWKILLAASSVFIGSLGAAVAAVVAALHH